MRKKCISLCLVYECMVLKKKFGGGSLCTRGAAGIQAVVFFSTTYFGENIVFELSKDQTFTIRCTLMNPAKFLILVTHLNINISRLYVQLFVKKKTNLKKSKVTFLYGRNVSLQLFSLVFFTSKWSLKIKKNDLDIYISKFSGICIYHEIMFLLKLNFWRFERIFNEILIILSGSRSFWNLGFPRRDWKLPRRDLVRDRDENEIFKNIKNCTKTMSRSPWNQRCSLARNLARHVFWHQYGMPKYVQSYGNLATNLHAIFLWHIAWKIAAI